MTPDESAWTDQLETALGAGVEALVEKPEMLLSPVIRRVVGTAMQQALTELRKRRESEAFELRVYKDEQVDLGTDAPRPTERELESKWLQATMRAKAADSEADRFNRMVETMKVERNAAKHEASEQSIRAERAERERDEQRARAEAAEGRFAVTRAAENDEIARLKALLKEVLRALGKLGVVGSVGETSHERSATL